MFSVNDDDDDNDDEDDEDAENDRNDETTETRNMFNVAPHGQCRVAQLRAAETVHQCCVN